MMMKTFGSALVASAILCAPALAEDAPTPAAEPVANAEASAAPAEAPSPQSEAATVETPAAEAPASEAAAPPEAPVAKAVAASASGRVPAPPAGKAQVVFFRPSSLLGAALSFTIKDGGTPVTKLGLGRYFVHVVDPGTHTFEVSGETTDTLNLEVDPDETYYIKQSMGMGALIYRANLSPSDQATFDGIKSLKLAEASKPKT